MDELIARLRVALRAPAAGDEVPVVETADFSIDLAKKQVRLADGADVRLTATEWQVVGLLARNPDKLLTHRQILGEVWGLSDMKTNLLRVFMTAIRRKLGPDPGHPRYFITEPGPGLRFVPQPAGRTVDEQLPLLTTTEPEL
ncbi:MAG: winged helix-turn-helix domain-containing protein [Acidimicrobiales bacterium]|jgi:two-component system, OmpR family, KDP operon response regulator KdpE